jgi:hypothetical protein
MTRTRSGCTPYVLRSERAAHSDCATTNVAAAYTRSSNRRAARTWLAV